MEKEKGKGTRPLPWNPSDVLSALLARNANVAQRGNVRFRAIGEGIKRSKHHNPLGFLPHGRLEMPRKPRLNRLRNRNDLCRMAAGVEIRCNRNAIHADRFQLARSLVKRSASRKACDLASLALRQGNVIGPPEVGRGVRPCWRAETHVTRNNSLPFRMLPADRVRRAGRCNVRLISKPFSNSHKCLSSSGLIY